MNDKFDPLWFLPKPKKRKVIRCGYFCQERPSVPACKRHAKKEFGGRCRIHSKSALIRADMWRMFKTAKMMLLLTKQEKGE